MIGNRKVIAAVAAGILGFAGNAAAQGYPERIIELIVPATPSSSADILGRVLADGISAQLGQRVVVLNKPGAGGMLGTAEAARAKPDGYTLLHTAVYAMTVQPLTERQVSYTHKSFEPICQTFKNDQVIVARPNTYKNVADLLAASKAKPGGLNYGTPGVGTIPYLSIAELSQLTHVEFNNVPFRGPPETIQMTAAGQIDFAVSPLTAAAGSTLAMPGLFAEKRNPSIPDVPTVREQGYDVAPLSIGGLFAPAGISAEVRRKLDDACKTVMQSEAFQRIAKRTFQPSDYAADAAGFKANIERDVAEKRKLLTALGMVKQ
jgi:tripartite-type tricarboxylate transporter receptor subunit TctC